MLRRATGLTVCAALSVLLGVGPAFAAKSNQVRPTPSPVTNPTLGPGEWLVTPSVAYAFYEDHLQTGIPEVTQDYRINSLGGLLEAQVGIAEWFSLEIGLEGYRKFGTITGPSPGDVRRLVEAAVYGYAFKLGVQANFRVFQLGEAGGEGGEAVELTPGDFSAYLFVKGLGDYFRQSQREPLYELDFEEGSFTYRAGVAANIYLYYGFFAAPFVGLEGVAFSGSRRDHVIGAAATVRAFGGAEIPYPFFGFDVLWAPPFLYDEVSYDNALSLGAILALTSEDASGYGGQLWTFNLGWTFAF